VDGKAIRDSKKLENLLGGEKKGKTRGKDGASGATKKRKVEKSSVGSKLKKVSAKKRKKQTPTIKTKSPSVHPTGFVRKRNGENTGTIAPTRKK